MARIRYVGPAQEGKDVSLSGGYVHFPRMQWVDLIAEAEKAHIRKEHAEVAARDLVTLPDWESEPHKKAAKTRAANAAAETDDPAQPDEEQT